jgi:hypothetical protein
MNASNHGPASRVAGRTLPLLALAALQGCVNSEATYLSKIGQVTERGNNVLDDREFEYEYVPVGTPLALELVRLNGRDHYAMIPVLFDAGVPIIMISETGLSLDEGDREIASKIARGICAQRPDWRKDTAESLIDQEVEFEDFLFRGVWSFAQECK